MNVEPNPKQTLYLWSLLVNGGEEFLKVKDVRPSLPSAERKALVAAGLVEEEKHADRAYYNRLTESGWAWIDAHLDAPLPLRSQAAVQVLGSLLVRLDAYKKSSETPLAALIAPPVASAGTAQNEQAQAGNLTAQIRQAYLDLSGGLWNQRVRIADLRRQLVTAAREVLDEQLRELQRQGVLVLYSIDDPLDITPEDEAAAVDVAGAKRQILYMEG